MRYSGIYAILGIAGYPVYRVYRVLRMVARDATSRACTETCNTRMSPSPRGMPIHYLRITCVIPPHKGGITGGTSSRDWAPPKWALRLAAKHAISGVADHRQRSSMGSIPSHQWYGLLQGS